MHIQSAHRTLKLTVLDANHISTKVGGKTGGPKKKILKKEAIVQYSVTYTN